MITWKIFSLLSLGFTWKAHGSEITMTRFPPCDPVEERTQITLTGTVTTPWGLCHWFHNGIRVCDQYRPGSEDAVGQPIDCFGSDASDDISGGNFSPYNCNLVLNNINGSHTGTWMVEITYDQSQNRVNGALDLVVSKPPMVTLLPLSSSQDLVAGKQMNYSCLAADGLPKADSFRWTINGDDSFSTFRLWQAAWNPLELQGVSNVSQLLSVVLPDVGGIFTLECETKTFLFNHTVSSSINITINGNGTMKVASDTIIIIVLAIILLIIIVVVIFLAICYFCGCLLFAKKEKNQTTKEPQAKNQMPPYNVSTPLKAKKRLKQPEEKRQIQPTFIPSKNSAFEVPEQRVWTTKRNKAEPVAFDSQPSRRKMQNHYNEAFVDSSQSSYNSKIPRNLKHLENFEMEPGSLV